jgi:hypothetical protein
VRLALKQTTKCDLPTFAEIMKCFSLKERLGGTNVKADM